MPKAMSYTKGSIIYFSGDKDERIFILQKGFIVLTSTEAETGQTVTEYVKEGEFFGVKSALGRFPRDETATVAVDSSVISMSVPEFEQLFSSNKQVIMKMLKVFSKQLRSVHKKIESILGNGATVNLETGMISVAQSFYNDEQYRSCCDVCLKFLTLYPQSTQKGKIAQLYADSRVRFDKLQSRRIANEEKESDPSEKAFSLQEIVELLHSYDFTHQRRLSFEYIMFAGVNDSTAHARELLKLLKGLECRVNLIRFHPVPGVDLTGTDEKGVMAFRDYLTGHGLFTTVRASRGQDIFAACGLLSTAKQLQNAEHEMTDEKK